MASKKLFLYNAISNSEAASIHRILSKTNDILLNEGISYLGRLDHFFKHTESKYNDDEVLAISQNKISKEIAKPSNSKSNTYILVNQISASKIQFTSIAQSQKKLFDPFTFDIGIILFLKRQDLFVEFSFAEMILNGVVTDFEKYVNQIDKSDLDWYPLLEAYSSIFGKHNIHLREFKSAYYKEKRDFIREFGSVVNSSALQNYLGSISKKNFSMDVLEIFRITNQCIERNDWKKLFEVHEHAGQHINEGTLFTHEARKHFMSNYDKSNKKIGREFAGLKDENFFSTKSLPYQNKLLRDEDRIKKESLTLAYIKSVLDLKNYTDQTLNQQQEKNKLEKGILKIWHNIRLLIHGN